MAMTSKRAQISGRGGKAGLERRSARERSRVMTARAEGLRQRQSIAGLQRARLLTSKLLWRLAQHDLVENVAKGNLLRGETGNLTTTSCGETGER